MKRIIPVLAIILLAGCHKGDNTLSKAVITGYDYRACACCGGLMVNLGDNTRQYDSNFYLVSRLPPGSNIGPADTFPIKVYIQWQPDTVYRCGGNNRIIITDLVKR
ncbi:hypothetical protein ACTHGU_20595 [Chitinophagaceae bacterium MMS25-I14]